MQRDEVPRCEGAEATGVGSEDRHDGEPYQHVDLTTDMPMLDRELGLQMTAANGCQQMRAPRVVFFTSRVGNSASWIWVFVRSSKSCEVLLSCVDSKVQDRP